MPRHALPDRAKAMAAIGSTTSVISISTLPFSTEVAASRRTMHQRVGVSPARRYPVPCPWLTDQSIGGRRLAARPHAKAYARTKKEPRPVVDFTLTDEQKDLREMAHNFAENEIRKVAWEYDKDGTWPQDIIDKAWEVGLMNTHTPEAYGGPGLDYLSGCLIEEEIGWGCSGIGTSLMANGLASAPVALAGSEETKKEFLGMLTEAPKLASFCLTEPDAGSDVSGMKTTPVRNGDKDVLNGAKCFIATGGYADWFT